MKNHNLYMENAMKYFNQGMDICSACDKAIAVDYLGEDLIDGLGVDAPEVINFAVIVNNYINLNEKIKELKNYEKVVEKN